MYCSLRKIMKENQINQKNLLTNEEKKIKPEQIIG